MSLKISKISISGFEIVQKLNEIYESYKIEKFTPHVTSRDRPKIGFGYGAETSNIFSFGYGQNFKCSFGGNFS